MNDKLVFFFGAGAESDAKTFNLPSGSEYTHKTMRQRQEKLYHELNTFYDECLIPKDYVKKYSNKFLFEKGSHTFREIIYRAALQYDKAGNKDSGIAVYDEFVKCALIVERLNNENSSSKPNDAQKKANAELKEKAKEVYDYLIKNDDNHSTESAEAQRNGQQKSLKDYLSFYGAVEKDFSSIINPNEVGLTQFWRVINYFWSAFFTILEPMCCDFEWYKKVSADKQKFYHYVLNNLRDVLSSIYEDYNYERIDGMPGNYYKHISDSYPNCMAVTTNYTPFVEHYFKGNNVYLAGRLSEFEFPCELAVKNITKTDFKHNEFIFPFLMTQAPIKPIIVPNQIREYATMLKAFEEADTLVIIGYSLGSADNHINAMLREYALTPNKKIIYCYYGKEAEDNIRRYVLNCLKMSDDTPNIRFIKNTGNAESLVKQLMDIHV